MERKWKSRKEKKDEKGDRLGGLKRKGQEVEKRKEEESSNKNEERQRGR